MKRYRIELNEYQLATITEALDQYARLSCMQFDEYWFWHRISECAPKYKLSEEGLERFRDDIQRVKQHYVGGRGAWWCASPFVTECFHIEKSLTPVFCAEKKKQDPHHTCTRCDGDILTEDTHDKITITEITE